jgi:O-antigen/teichoic acid export membrane protein
MNIPYALQLANGWTRLALYSNLVAIIILTPMIIYMTSQYGALGGASGWLILNSGYVLFSMYFMHRRLLPHEKWHWYGIDVGLPLAAALLTAGILRLMMPVLHSKFMLGAYIVMVLTITLVAAALAAPFTRLWIKNWILKLRILHVA